MAYLAYILECINNILNVHKQLTRNKCTLQDTHDAPPSDADPLLLYTIFKTCLNEATILD